MERYSEQNNGNTQESSSIENNPRWRARFTAKCTEAREALRVAPNKFTYLRRQRRRRRRIREVRDTPRRLIADSHAELARGERALALTFGLFDHRLLANRARDSAYSRAEKFARAETRFRRPRVIGSFALFMIYFRVCVCIYSDYGRLSVAAIFIEPSKGVNNKACLIILCNAGFICF